MNDDGPNTLINSDLLQTIEGKFSRLDLFYQGKSYRVGLHELPFLIGRDHDTCHLVVQKDVVSRVHCLVDVKENQIGVIDKSTNGTVVKMGDANSVIIRDEFYPLTGKGCLTLGEPFSSDMSDLILFKVVVGA